MKNYTKGTWTLVTDKPIGQSKHDYLIFSGKGGFTKMIARVIRSISITDEEHQDNARLLMAAPAMYEALKVARMALKELAPDAYRLGSVGAQIDQALGIDQEHPLPTDHNQEQFENK